MSLIKVKFFLITVVLVISILYSYPNIYGESPAVLVSSNKKVDNTFLEKIKFFCDNKLIKNKIVLLNSNKLVIKFFSTADQFYVYDELKNKGLPVNLSLSILNNNSKFFNLIKAYPMHFGLDLRGGVHLLLKVNNKYSIDAIVNSNIEVIKQYIKENNYKIVKSKSSKIIYIKFFTYKVSSDFIFFLNRYITDFSILERSSSSVKLKLKKSKEIEIKYYNIERTIHVLSKRVNELGLSDSSIRQHGIDKIVVEIPGIQDISYAKTILGKTATLKFMLIDDFYDKVFDIKNDKLVKPFYTKEGKVVFLKNKILLTGESIIHAVSGLEGFLNKPCINIKIKKNYVKSFKKDTKLNIGKYMAIVYQEYVVNRFEEGFKETVINIAKIMTELGENFQITGLDMSESKDLALLLRAGSLPTSISIVEEKVIGPTLGEKNIRHGIISVGLSILVVCAFLIFRYKKYGLFACFSLFSNVFLLIAILSILSLTLTLPSLAGLALTIGMSIDANILIFERIKEEYVFGNTFNAIESGFKNAFISIFDSNITTLLIGLSLFFLGTGPIKGFAITLSVGIIISFYSSIFVTKTLIDFFLKKNY